MTEYEHKTLINRFIDAYNSFDVDGMVALVHPDVIFKNVSGGEVNATAVGIDELRELANQSKAMFSSRQQTITGFSSSGNCATVGIEYEGVLATDLPNGMKAGRRDSPERQIRVRVQRREALQNRGLQLRKQIAITDRGHTFDQLLFRSRTVLAPAEFLTVWASQVS